MGHARDSYGSRSSGIGLAAADQPGQHSAGVTPSGPHEETYAWCRVVALALAARPWVGGHSLVTTQTGLNSDAKHAPASRAGTSVALAQNCVASVKCVRFFRSKNSSKVTLRWMRSGEASSSGLVSKPSLPNLPLLSALGVCAISVGANL